MPALVVEIYEKFMAGDLVGALLPSTASCPAPGVQPRQFPAVTKDAMNLLGLNVGKLIRPTASCTPANQAKLARCWRTWA